MAKNLYEQLQKNQSALDAKQAVLSGAESTLESLNKQLASFAEYETQLEAAQRDMRTQNDALSNAYDALQDKIDADVKAGKLQDIDFEVMKRDLEKKKKAVEDLSGNNGGNEVTAKPPAP